MTFETPYTYYNNDPAGEWVSRESLAELAHASLLALSDLLDLGGSERRQADSERMKARGKWLRRTAKDRQFSAVPIWSRSGKGPPYRSFSRCGRRSV